MPTSSASARSARTPHGSNPGGHGGGSRSRVLGTSGDRTNEGVTMYIGAGALVIILIIVLLIILL